MNLYSYFNSPVIVPPVPCDDPSKGKPSDHWVPVCTPHTDRYNPPLRHYKTIKFRPLPESSLRKFGEWIVMEGWKGVSCDLSPTQQVDAFEQIILDKLNTFCPEKSIRLSSQDKPWVTGELKAIDRLKNREYNKRGKTLKYKELAKIFEQKYKMEAQKFLTKNVDELMECNPGKAYNI